MHFEAEIITRPHT